MDCLFDKEYDGLILKGEPTTQQITDAWNKIYAEFANLTSDGNYNELYDLTREINEIHYSLLFIDGAIKHLQLHFDFIILKMLNTFGFRCDLKETDGIEITNKKLALTRKRSKSLEIRAELKQKEYDKLQGEGIVKNGVGRYTFYEHLTALGTHFGYAVKEHDITVVQYCRDIKRLDEEYRKRQLKNAT